MQRVEYILQTLKVGQFHLISVPYIYERMQKTNNRKYR